MNGIAYTANSLIDTSFINVKDLGAVGDGYKDDSEVIQHAIDLASTTDGTVFIPKGNYLINTTLTISSGCKILGESKHSTRLIAGKSLLDITGDSPIIHPMITCDPPVIQSGLLSASYPSQYICKDTDSFVTIDNTSSIKDEDIIEIYADYSQHPWLSDNRGYLVFGETNQVSKLDGSTVNLHYKLTSTYPYTSNIHYKIIRPVTKLVLDSFSISVEPQIQGYNKCNFYNGIMLFHCVDATVSNIFAEGFGNISISSSTSINTLITDCRVLNGYTLDKDDNLYGIGYGLRLVQDRCSRITNCTSRECRHCCDISGDYPTHDCVVENCFMSNSLEILDQTVLTTHSPACNCTFRNNTVSGPINAIGTSGFNMNILGNHVLKGNIYLVGAMNYLIEDNILDNGRVRITRPETNDPSYYIIVRRNILRNSASAIALLRTAYKQFPSGETVEAPFDTVYGFIICDNVVYSSQSTGGLIDCTYAIGEGSASTTITFRNGFIVNNNYVHVGTLTRLDSSITVPSGISTQYGSNDFDTYSVNVECTANTSSNIKYMIGSPRYNKRLHKPLWYDGTSWRDAEGNVIS